MSQNREPSIEERLRKVEDTLAIYRLIASHPPAVDAAQRIERPADEAYHGGNQGRWNSAARTRLQKQY